MDLTALTFAVAYHKGVYVPLLASGVSRAAKIPTAFEIASDLIRQIAASEHAGEQVDPFRWYRERFSEEPSYSTVVRRIGHSPADRARVLRPYFEPSAEERGRGVKVPTRAHRAIAELCARGHFRVILTTNFDDLMETALRDRGLSPVVASTQDQVERMAPLAHAQLVVIKLNGDFLDMDTRNLPDELHEYGATTSAKLDQILDEFGIIVCGWSAEFDVGLRAAFERCQTRRYSTFWTTLGSLGPQAAKLVAAREAHEVRIPDADSFFSTLEGGVAALEAESARGEGSKALTTARLKRLLQDDSKYIDLEELVLDAARSASAAVDALALDMSGPRPTKEETAARVVKYEGSVESLLPVLMVGGYWGRARHAALCVRAVNEVMPRPGPIRISV